ncbi:MAG: response regulator [Angelakisella sp.]
MINVLLVDDEEPSREYIRSLIDWENNGFCLAAEAQNVCEALEILKTTPIQMVLFDVFMPGQNGVDLSRAIAEHYGHVMMIAVSSFDSYDYVREILKNGAHDYILKHRLNSDSLLTTLNGVKNRLQAPSRGPKPMNQLRHKTEEWLLEGKACPFPIDGSRLVVTVAYLPEEKFDTSLQTAITSGIIDMLEACSAGEGREVVALYCPPKAFMLCTRFIKTISEAHIQSCISFNNIKIQSNIKLLYKTTVIMVNCPPSFSRARLPEYIRGVVGRLEGKVFPLDATDCMGLSITAQKQLLTALEEHNAQAAQLVIETVFSNIMEGDETPKLLVTRELFETLVSAAKEYGVNLEFINTGEQWYQWSRRKSPQEISVRMTGLYRQVIQESKPNHREYSQNVRQANEFMDKHYGSSISPYAVAESIGVSASYLSRIYRKETGSTMVDYLNRVRISAAKGHLSHGKTIKETVFMCGFSSYNYFIKVFKDYEGITPKEFLDKKD